MEKLEQKTITVAEMKNPKCLYVLKGKDGSVKVGVSNDVDSRKKIIQGQSGRKIVKSWVSGFCSNAYEIEAELKTMLSRYNICGEWYKAKYENVESLAIALFVKMHREDERPKSDGLDRLLDFIFSKKGAKNE